MLERIGGFLSLILNLSNIGYAIAALLKPLSREHTIVNTVYLTIGCVVLIQFYLALCKNKTELFFPAWVLVGLRNAIRLFDFENTAEVKGNDVLIWVIGQLNVCGTMSLFMTIFFVNRKHVIKVTLAFILFFTIGGNYAFAKMKKQ